MPFIMESGNLENVMDMAPTVYYSQKQRSMYGSTVVDGKMERSMYVSDTLLYTHCNKMYVHPVIYFVSLFLSL